MRVRPLHAGRAEFGCIANALPVRRRLWRMPAERTDGRRGVRDSFENIGAHGGDATDEFSLSDADVRRRGLGKKVEGKKRKE